MLRPNERTADRETAVDTDSEEDIAELKEPGRPAGDISRRKECHQDADATVLYEFNLHARGGDEL